jgi:hypothetical protein
MRILEYKLHAPMKGEGMSTPSFITNGGYFYNRTDHTIIAGEPDVTQYYIPDSVTVYTVAELKTRMLTMHGVTAFQKMGATHADPMEDMTDAEVEAMVDAWVTANS